MRVKFGWKSTQKHQKSWWIYSARHWSTKKAQVNQVKRRWTKSNKFSTATAATQSFFDLRWVPPLDMPWCLIWLEVIIEYLSAQARNGCHVLQVFEAMGEHISPVPWLWFRVLCTGRGTRCHEMPRDATLELRPIWSNLLCQRWLALQQHWRSGIRRCSACKHQKGHGWWWMARCKFSICQRTLHPAILKRIHRKSYVKVLTSSVNVCSRWPIIVLVFSEGWCFFCCEGLVSALLAAPEFHDSCLYYM